MYDPLAALTEALIAADSADRRAAILASFAQAHVVMTVADYNDDLAAMFEWQESAKAALTQYKALHGPLPGEISLAALSDLPLEYVATEDDL